MGVRGVRVGVIGQPEDVAVHELPAGLLLLLVLLVAARVAGEVVLEHAHQDDREEARQQQHLAAEQGLPVRGRWG